MTPQQMTQIGTKRQLTLSKAILDYYGLGEGSPIMIEMKDNHLELHPVVALKRDELPKELREKFLSRLGGRSTNVPLNQFLDKIGYKGPRGKTHAGAAKRTTRPAAKSAAGQSQAEGAEI
ncbi:MAG: AbrB/MazE/SpoVT family DNA-binding domain-containing protein [Terracidiphilus sp.]